MFMRTLFIIGKNWKQPKCPSLVLAFDHGMARLVLREAVVDAAAETSVHGNCSVDLCVT